MIRSKTIMAFLWALLALALHLCPGIIAPAHAQGSRKDDIVFNSRGVPLAGATVRVCAMPASGQPCTPLAQIFSDPALTQALANPTTTDGLGNYSFYAAPGKYEIEISGPGIATKQLPNVILPNDPSSPTFSSLSSTGAISAFSLSLTGNLTVNGNTTVVGNMASGTLNLTNQSTPPGAAGSGTVNLYTKTADKRLYYKDDTGAEQGPLGAGASTSSTNTFTAAQNFDADTHSKGPNPWFDLSRYGGYNVSGTPPSTTGSITSGSTTLTLASAQDFANGQGIAVYKAGPATSLTTPGQPTVTPTNLLNGSTTYTYQVVAEDRNGGLTAASTAGSTTTGAATLGVNSVTLSSCVRTNGVTTYTSSANHNLQSGAQVSISGFGGGVFDYCNGTKTIASTPTGTTFTTTDGILAANETNTSGTPTAAVVACNTLTFASGSFSGLNTIHYWIYRNNALVGLAVGIDPWLMDCNYGVPTAPAYVPSTPPGSAQPGYLATTIASGGGTTTLTLASSASSTVSSQTVLHDNSPNFKSAIQAAYNSAGGTVYIPNAGANQWPFNSAMDMTSLSGTAVRLYINSDVVLINQPWLLHSNTSIEGEAHDTTSFQYIACTKVGGSANPMFVMPAEQASSIHFRRIYAQGSGNQQVLFLSDEGTDGGANTGLVMDDVSLATANNTGTPLLLKGGFDFHVTRGVCATPGATTFNGGTCVRLTNSSPAVTGSSQGQIPGRVMLDAWYMANTAIDVDCLPGTPQAAFGFTFRNILFESAVTPFVRVNCNNGSGVFGLWNLDNLSTADTLVGVGTPVFDAQNVGNQFGLVTSNMSSAWSGGVPFVIGPGATTGSVSLANTNIVNPGNVTYGYFGPGVSSSGNIIGSLIELPMANPAAPSVVVSSGGNVPIGTQPYSVQFLDVNGNASALSPSTNAVTSTGNQTVTVTRPSAPPGAVSWLAYRNGIRIVATAIAVPVATSSVQDTQSFTNGNSSLVVAAGVSTLAANGLSGLGLTLVNNGFTWATSFPNSLSANRTLSIPDVSGYSEISGYVNSAYDNFTRANGAIGSNWSVAQGGLNVTSNTIQGTAGSANNTAFWIAPGSAFAAPQFSEATITALNGTSDFPGVMVLLSGSGGSTQGYDCVEDTTNIFIQRVNGGTNTNLTSAATTGAIGDVLRLEVAPGGFLTCYKNGVSTLTATDTTYTTGSPGLNLFSNVATEKNWSGGNLHPFAHLDLEQDWTKPQHFNGGMTVGPTNGASVGQFEHQRSSTGIAANTRLEVTLSWPVPFADSSYTVVCSVEDSTTAAGTQGLVYERIRTKTASQVGVVVNNPTAGSITGTFDCAAWHP